ncbi:MAG: RNA polymerase sporulation sigma factor SigH [Lachnospiraceae bacterium]|jgi:RNA polymerase sporulation-specific sigma factor|uniref:RNA polymerase sporulation sigma factor SigH n=1 Tax=Hominisplanchenecus murintestinalis TaxID=2941517 RepID=A0AC61R117_9FIRM|nr:RNA polymerase sporulation sigma factor SigH [Hominisplanchenecus murintestinalis]MCI9515501.1 RNA polymerase sporulation sigma factor SigH [Lachnospiraceae bacterium]RKJ88733.1 RNA polymerase sporulation sigma factor SigH [Anaerotruncus sp. 1XD22-93]MCI9660332.1 RNA polymerase sporulation sigma factor SigH [Lachnospiraceae bacterium]MDE6907710.1 RNA polymerase sporulation sigma factor SigH [Lachnospiraceae bacterium]NBH98588.1 RNA polymerase sporulation sigma factor SigH [Lachnospiraceae b
MGGYEGYSDEELIAMMKRGEPEIMDYLMEKYKNLVRRKARALYLIGGDGDDLIQEGMIGLFKAVRDYNAEKEASFGGFADLCISRQMYTAVEASARKKHIPLNSYISLYSGTISSREHEVPLRDVLPDSREINPEELVIGREDREQMHREMKKRLSGFETQVLEAYLEGMNYKEIGEALGKPAKAIDNALQRIRKKITEKDKLL